MDQKPVIFKETVMQNAPRGRAKGMPPRPTDGPLTISRCVFRIMTETRQFVDEIGIFIEHLLRVSMIRGWQREFLPSSNSKFSVIPAPRENEPKQADVVAEVSRFCSLAEY